MATSAPRALAIRLFGLARGVTMLPSVANGIVHDLRHPKTVEQILTEADATVRLARGARAITAHTAWPASTTCHNATAAQSPSKLSTLG
jgi:hypothetical protein